MAIDAAGNETESEPIRVYIVHKEEEEETEQSAVLHVAMIWPARRKEQQTLPSGTSAGGLLLPAIPPVGLVYSKPLNNKNRDRREHR